MVSAAVGLAAACWPLASCAPRAGRIALPDEMLGGLAALSPADGPTVSAAAATTPVAEPSLEAARRFARAKWLLLGRDPAGAVAELKAARSLDPDSPQILKLLGEALWAANRRDEAAEAYRQTLRIGGDDIDSNYQLGWYHYLRDEFEAARRHFKAVDASGKAHSALPQYVMCQFYLARCEDRLRNTEAAIAKYKRFAALTASYRSGFRALPELLWLMREPSLIPIYIARAYATLEQYDDAAATLVAANRRHPTWVLGHVELARIHLLAGRGREALQVSRDIATRLPANREALKLTAEVHKALRQLDGLLEFLATLSAENPDQIPLLEFRAETLKEAGKAEEAGRVYQQVLTLRADSPTALLELARLQERKGELKAALLTLSRGLDRSRPDGGLAAVYLRRFIRRAEPEKRDALLKGLVADLPAAAADSAPRMYLLAGLLAVEADRLDDAAAYLRASLAKLTDVAFVYASLGAAYAEAGKTARALAVYRKALAAGLRDPFFHRASGDLHMAAGEGAKARDAYREALNLDPEHVDSRLGLAMAYAKLGQYLSAEAELRRVLKARPANTTARLALGEVLLSGLRDAVRAAGEARGVLAVDPGNRAALQLLARTRIHLKQYDKALAILTPMVTGTPKDWRSRLLLAAVYLTRQDEGDLALAAEQLEAVLVERPKLLEAMSMLVDVRLGQKAYPRASELLERILKIAPDDSASLRTLAAVRINLGQTQQAVALLRKLVEDNPRNTHYMEDLSVALSRAGKHAESERVLEEILQIDPMHPGANNNLGYAWADRGVRLDDAERMIRRALDKEPKSIAYRDSLGWVLYKKGSIRKAAEQLGGLLKEAKARIDSVIWDHQGDCLWRLGKREEAIAAWQASLRENKLEDEQQKQTAERTRRKLESARSGKPVEVAPLGGGRTASPD